MRYPSGIDYDPQVSRPKRPKRRKYLAKKTVVDGIEFDSKKEAQYYYRLTQAGLKDGVDFKRQVRFTVFDAKKTKVFSKKPRKRVYKTDFAFYKGGKLIYVVDVKGYKVLPLASLKMDMFSAKYQVPVYIARWNRKLKRFDETMR